MPKLEPGRLIGAILSGIPEDLLVPVVPGNLPLRPGDRIKKDHLGKAPAMYGSAGWYLAPNWQGGVSKESRDLADAVACNWGFRLGEVAGGYRYLALDIDTEFDDEHPNGEASLLALSIQKEALKFFRAEFGGNIWFRLTRPGRLGILVRIPASESAGAKHAVFLVAPDGSAAGKIELLAKGQQFVIAGVHPHNEGTVIRWARSDNREYAPWPNVGDEVFPNLGNRQQVGDALDRFVKVLGGPQFNLTFGRLGRPAGAAGERISMPPERQAAWSTPDFVAVVDNMPHPSDMSRDDYVNMMLAFKGCIDGSIAAKISAPDDRAEMVECACRWAARWDGIEGNLVDAYEVWEKDYSQRTVTSLGWPTITDMAVSLGNTELRSELTKRSFTAQMETPLTLTNRVEGKGLPTPRRDQSIQFDVKTSDIQIADYIERSLSSLAAWIEDERRWIVWGGSTMGWSHPYGERIVREWIADDLIRYVERFADSLGDNQDTKAKLTSASRINAMVEIMRTRLGVQSNDTNQGHGWLQTPLGVYSLSSEEVMNDSDDRQKRLLERRMTSIAPASGPCPLFDGLIRHLCCYDEDAVEWVWCYLGYLMLGTPLEHILLVIYGPGKNGKSRFLSLVRRILGSYAVQLDRRVLLQSGQNDHQTGLWEAKDTRLWAVSEFQAGEKWNEAQVRSMSGGDPIKARQMRKDMGTFIPEGSLLIVTNYVPTFHRIDMAVVRRLRILHARVPILSSAQDMNFEENVMAQEAPQILWKMIQYARVVKAAGVRMPPVPASMTSETMRYFSTQDQFYAWFNTECEAINDTTNLIDMDVLYKRYRRFSERQDENINGDMEQGVLELMSQTAFSQALRRSGVIVDNENGRRLKAIDEYGRERFVATGIKLKIALVA
jgi:P4 family phage/plasmid primase-like protien